MLNYRRVTEEFQAIGDSIPPNTLLKHEGLQLAEASFGDNMIQPPKSGWKSIGAFEHIMCLLPGFPTGPPSRSTHRRALLQWVHVPVLVIFCRTYCWLMWLLRLVSQTDTYLIFKSCYNICKRDVLEDVPFQIRKQEGHCTARLFPTHVPWTIDQLVRIGRPRKDPQPLKPKACGNYLQFPASNISTY